MLLRLLFSAVSGFGLGLLAYGGYRAWSAQVANRWNALGFDWLTLDLWSRLTFWKHASMAAGVALVLALVLELLARKESLRGLGKWTRLAGHPIPALALLLLALFLPARLAAWTQPSPPAESPNVLFVLVDTWRADHAGFLGYERDVSPNLDRLVERGVVFENAIAQSGWTKPSVATLFTGLLPSRHRAVSQPQIGMPVRGISLLPGVTTVVEILRAKGWDTGMWSNNPNILPIRGFDQGARHFVDYFAKRTPERDAGRAEWMLPDVRRWLADEREADRPFFAYVHIMDPHYPYVAPPPFQGKYDRSGLDFQLAGPLIDEYMRGDRDLSEVSPEMLQRIVDIYDEELCYVDHYLGPFLEEVMQRYPDTLIVLSGDHGEEFLEHGQFGHSHSIYSELTHVPLVFWGPDLAPARIPHQVRLMDVMPTLLDAVGLDQLVPPGVQGTSLLPVLDGSETGHRLAPMESGGDERPAFQWRGISDGTYKVIRRENDLETRKPVPSIAPWDTGERPYWLLFDVNRDRGELDNLYASQEERALALFKEMIDADWYRPPEDVLQMPAARGDDGGVDLDLLRKLGYAGEDEEE